MNSVSAAVTVQPAAISIGLCALGCLDEEGRTCSNFEQGLCAGGRASKCMTRAMVDHPESQAEIVLASISVMARKATSGSQLIRMLPRVERVIEETACA
jgi:hypothetical protein